MKSYCFVGWRQAAYGREIDVDLPEDAGFLVLAQPHGNEYALIELELPSGETELPGAELVSEELASLLDSAHQYAPALAISRDQMQRVDCASRSQFSFLLASSLRAHLSGQRRSGYFLAQACKTESGYKYAGDYYWIVGYRPKLVGYEVEWVSRDFFVYQDSVTDFDVDVAYLEEAFPLNGT